MLAASKKRFPSMLTLLNRPSIARSLTAPSVISCSGTTTCVAP